MTPLLSVRNLSVTFDVRRPGSWPWTPSLKLHAVSEVSFDIQPGECLGIVGESGSGKSTIARMIAGLYTVDGGSVSFDGQQVTGARGGVPAVRLAARAGDTAGRALPQVTLAPRSDGCETARSSRRPCCGRRRPTCERRTVERRTLLERWGSGERQRCARARSSRLTRSASEGVCRAGASAGGSVRRPRCASTFRITIGSVIVAMRWRRPPQRGQRSTSTPNVRSSSSAQVRRDDRALGSVKDGTAVLRDARSAAMRWLDFSPCADRSSSWLRCSPCKPVTRP